MVVLGGERLLEHHDLVVIDEEQHGETGFGDQLEEDVVEDLLDGLDGVRRGREEQLGFEDEVRLNPYPVLTPTLRCTN